MRDRIVELRRVKASELRSNPKNPRRHPEGQQEVLRDLLGEIGFADAVLARETDTGLEIIDGHLRKELSGDELVPVLILDVDEQEADKLLATIDPLVGMAQFDPDALRKLLDGVQTQSEAVGAMLQDLLHAEAPDFNPVPPDTQGQLDQSLTRTVKCPDCGKVIEL